MISFYEINSETFKYMNQFLDLMTIQKFEGDKKLELITIDISRFEELKKLHLAYKLEIEEEIPKNSDYESLFNAIETGKIQFFGVLNNDLLVAICSICITYSTFNYKCSGIFEDFYIMPEFRHKKIARQLVEFAYHESGVCSLGVGAADCDVEMYKALGFFIELGNYLMFTE